jgi:formate hydrogenlyase subunit 3/multisubunit Na+/H+ antiporter MnhD subunit
MTPEYTVLWSILICLGGAVLTLGVAKHRALAGWLALAVTAATAALVFAGIARVLAAGAGQATAFPVGFGFSLRIYVDGLTAVFLGLAAFIGVMAALFSIAYLRHYPEYSVARYYPYLLTFQAAMYGLVSTTDMMWFFFVFWQMMTLPGYALIRFEHRNPANIRAANKYLVMMQIACAATMLGAEIIAVTGAAAGNAGLKYDFDTVSQNLPQLLSTQPGWTAVAFGLFLAGFGIKMGMWPFGQIWLPDAHPAAPSPVSAMLSGVMIKTGVYGLIRYFLWLVPPSSRADFPLEGWGLVVAVLGTITLFTGTVQALKQDQSKRLLAFHSIGQIGYILLGTGICLAMLSVPGPRFTAIATLGLFGALFHVLNHGVFKALLFLNAGSMLYATGTQDLNRMGGLFKYMPLTGATALVASFAIAGVPPLNGFASKWSLYVAAVQGSEAAGFLALCAVIAILTSVLTLASFMKFFGASFLSRSSALVKQARQAGPLEPPWQMLVPQVALAVVCLAAGLLPGVMFGFLTRALLASRQGLGTVLAGALPAPNEAWLALPLLGGRALLAPLVLALVLGIVWLIALGISRLGGAKRRATAPWLCGYALESEANRYQAHGFYGELKRGLGRLPGGRAAPPMAEGNKESKWSPEKN